MYSCQVFWKAPSVLSSPKSLKNFAVGYTANLGLKKEPMLKGTPPPGVRLTRPAPGRMHLDPEKKLHKTRDTGFDENPQTPLEYYKNNKVFKARLVS